MTLTLLFREYCLEVVCRAGHALSLEKIEDKMTVFLSENIIKRSLRFLVTTCLKKWAIYWRFY